MYEKVFAELDHSVSWLADISAFCDLVAYDQKHSLVRRMTKSVSMSTNP